ncbi:MAG: DUF2970 domain-containing protein [Marinobacter sp.]|nr:DUF2970 domain-containing protein [Marinobacter sp.]
MDRRDSESNDRDQPDGSRQTPPPKRPGLLKILQSVLAGAIGVQSSKHQAEDFSSSSPWAFIIAGILFTVGFVVTLILIVQWVLPD